MDCWRFQKISVFVLAGCLAAVAVACAQERFDRPEVQGIAEDEFKKIGNIDIHGLVLTENGREIDDVTIKYEVIRYGDVVAGVEPEKEILGCDGSFRITDESLTAISLVVSKEGFYTETWDFSFPKVGTRNLSGGYEVVDLRIVLTPKPDPAPLVELAGFLRSSENNPISVVYTSKHQYPPIPLTGEEREAWKIRMEKRPHVFLDGNMGGGKGFSVRTVESKVDSQSFDGLERSRVRPNPAVVGEGFVVFHPDENLFHSEHGLRVMNEAPVDGYLPFLELSAPDGAEVVYFYFFVDGSYGKGYVTGWPAVHTVDGDLVAVAKMHLFVNPTGSRNVAFIHN